MTQQFLKVSRAGAVCLLALLATACAEPAAPSDGAPVEAAPLAAQQPAAEPLPDEEPVPSEEPTPDKEEGEQPLAADEALVLEKVLHLYAETYGEDALDKPEGCLEQAECAELQERLKEALTDEEIAVLERYAERVPPQGLALAPPPPQLFYAVGSGAGDGSSDFYRFQVQHGVTVIHIFWFNITLPYARIINYTKIGETRRMLTDLAYEWAGGAERFYGIDFSNLYKLNNSTGFAGLLGGTVYGMLNSLDVCEGRLYAWSNTLVTLNSSTGAGSFVGNVGYSSSGDIACRFNQPAATSLYGAAAGNPDRLVRINRLTGAATWLGNLPTTSEYGLAFGQNGLLYVGAHKPSTINVSIISHASGGVIYPGLNYSTTAGLHGMAARFIPY